MIDYMLDWGVEEVLGVITLVDDLKQVANFWSKNGFSVDEEALAKNKVTKISILLNKTEKHSSAFHDSHNIEYRIVKG